MKDFRVIQAGAEAVRKGASDAHDSWRYDNQDDCVAEMGQVVKDCETLLAQARELHVKLKAAARPKL